jgi:flagellar basal body-associated protein FliL
MSTASSWIFVILLLVLFFVAIFAIPQWMLKRAMRQVIRILREHNATNTENAKTLEELGFKPRGITQNMLRGRDYKPYAVDVMVKAQIIQVTEDARLYLSEERLSTSKLIKAAPQR